MGECRPRALVAAAVLAGLVFIGSAGPAVADPDGVGAVDFYLPPSPLPASANGDLIRSEPMPLLAGMPLATLIPAATVTRIMYSSSDTHGAPIAVTGSVLTPSAPWLGPGSRPLVSYAVGTHGAGDNCAPSRLLADGMLTDGSGAPMVEVQIIEIAALLMRGIAVVVTDYQGLGTPGPHTYLQPVPEAHAVLDAARAAIRLGVVDPNARVGIWGYSQGGGAAAAAAEQANSYASDLNLAGTVVGAPPADPTAVIRNVDGRSLSGVTGFFLNGLIATYPELAPRILAQLNPRGIEYLHRSATQCTVGIALDEAFRSTADYTNDGAPIIDALTSDPDIRAVLDSMVLGGVAPADPVLLMQNVNDDVVPVGQTDDMVEKWRAAGANVTEADINTPPLLPEIGTLGHSVGVIGSSTAEQWLIDRFSE